MQTPDQRRLAKTKPAPTSKRASSAWREAYRLVVQCQSESEQQALYERLVAEGFKVRVLMM
jgi:DNA polymerase IIIc chi subunit